MPNSVVKGESDIVDSEHVPYKAAHQSELDKATPTRLTTSDGGDAVGLPPMAQPQQCAQAAHCLCAIGVLTTPDNSVRRRIARGGWTSDASSHGIVVRFLVRSRGLPVTTRSALDSEQRRHGDMLLLPVAATEHRLRGRILAFSSWLRLATVVCPMCRWVAKADDDTHIVTSSLAPILQLLDRKLGENARVVSGHLAWHTWNRDQFMHRERAHCPSSLTPAFLCSPPAAKPSPFYWDPSP